MPGVLGRCILVFASACSGAAHPVSSEFYSQRLDDDGIPILGHATVTPAGMREARARLDQVLHDAPRIRRNLVARGYQLHVAALAQFPSDLPEYRGKRGTILENGEQFDLHMIGGHLSEEAGHYSSCTEGTLLPVVGHRLFGTNVCVHELGHAIEWFAFDAAARARVFDEYRASMTANLWTGQYAATNAHEWFAEITRFYFTPDRPELAFYDPSLAHGHDWFCARDPRACAFARDVYADKLDPGTPQTIQLEPGPGTRELKSGDGHVPVRVIVRNATRERIHVVWIDFEGKRDTRAPFERQPIAAPGDAVAAFTWSTHAWLVTDDAQAPLCTIVAPEEEAVVEVTGRCP